MRPVKARQATIDQADRARAEAQINARIGNQEARLAPFHLAWRQELPITTCREGATAFSCGEEWAKALLMGEAEGPILSGVSGEVSRFVVETALERQGAMVAGGARRRASLRALSFCATIAALIWLCLLTLRSLRWPRLAEQDGRTVIALHAEAANRTRHVRNALKGRDCATTDVLFVGRPHMNRAVAEEMLKCGGWDGGFALAWDWRAVLAGIRAALRIVAQAPQAILAAGYRPTLAQLTAIELRIFLGTASAWRWEASKRAAQTVIFGHVGRADTILLEAAMQANGMKTVHWMHGVSVGRAYQGRSNLCVTLCSHDERWHKRILNYDRNVAFVLPRPKFRTGSKRGWAILTNMTHYGYTHFPAVGPAHEMRLIELIAELASREGVNPASVVWKPHPVFYQRDPQVRTLITRKLDELGFLLWPHERMPFDQIAAYETVIVTPSGVALELLKAGRLPVLAEFEPVDPDHALARLEPRGADFDSLKAALAIARDPSRAQSLFDKIWKQLGPAATATIAEIERVLATSPDSFH